MTVANSNMEWSITCDGATESATGVVLDAQLYDDDEIEVILKTIATGAESTLTKTSDYLVTGVPGATAVVKTTANYTNASAIYVRRTAVLSQTDDIVTGDPFPSEVIETILDKDAMALQVINNKAARGLQVTKASGLTDLTVIPTASKIIGFNAAGTALMLYDTSTDSGDASLADLLSASGFGTIIYPQEVQVGSTGIRVISGSGTPEASVTGAVGSIYLRTDGGAGTSVYRKESGAGNTGWVADSGLTVTAANAVVDQGGDGNLKCKSIQFGWNMDASVAGSLTKTIAHGLNGAAIYSVVGKIFDDGIGSFYPIPFVDEAGAAQLWFGGTGTDYTTKTGWDGTNIYLGHSGDAGWFDNVLFDATVVRGTVSIWYIS